MPDNALLYYKGYQYILLFAEHGELADMEAILCAPPPSLGAPLAHKHAAVEAADASVAPLQPVPIPDRNAQSSSSAGLAKPAGNKAGLQLGMQPQAEVPKKLPLRNSPVAPPITDAHREGPRVKSPRDTTVRCSITRAVVSPRSSDVAAAVQYRPGAPAAASQLQQRIYNPSQPSGLTTTSVHPLSSASADTCKDDSAVNGAPQAAQLNADQQQAEMGVHKSSREGCTSPGAMQGQGGITERGSREEAAAKGLIRLPKLGTYEKMTVAASVVGAVAGGVAAGPLGVSIGESMSPVIIRDDCFRPFYDIVALWSMQ